MLKEIEMPEIIMIDMDEIKPNPWNPNSMNADLFNELTRDIEEYGFVQPILVANAPEEKDYKYQIVDGEHRYDALKILGVDKMPCYIVDLDEDHQKFKTVRMNRLRGKMDTKKFTSLVEDLMNRYPLEEVAENLAFTDPTELEAMMDSARENLPTTEMKEEFDRAKETIKTVDDLSAVLNRLFNEFGDTLPANFMILDFGGKYQIWVRMGDKEFRPLRSKARECQKAGVTFDSLVCHVLKSLPVERYVERFGDHLVKVEVEKDGDIDDVK